jgi:hypothetical protein
VSTRIDHGYRIRGAAHNIAGIHQQIRHLIEPAYTQLYRTTIARVAAHTIDTLRDGGTVDNYHSSPHFHAVTTLDTLHRGSYRHPDTDLQLAITFHTAADNPDLYLLLFTEQATYRELFEQTGGIEPFPYWNNTDRPGDVTDTDWAARGQLWDTLVGRDAPARRGLTWTLIGDMHYEHVTAAELIDHLPDTRTRATYLAHRHIVVGDDCSIAGIVDAAREQLPTLIAQIEPTLTPITVTDLEHTPAGGPAC